MSEVQQSPAIRNYSSIPEGEFLDELVLDYLRFRGFSTTIDHFHKERKPHADYLSKRVQVECITERLLKHARSGDTGHLVALWEAISRWLLGPACGDIVQQMQNELWRFYMVAAVKDGKAERLCDFLSKHGQILCDEYDYSEWCSISHSTINMPRPRLRGYFEDSWAEQFELSLHNVLATAMAAAGTLRIEKFELTAQRLEAREVALAEHKKAMYEVAEELLMTTDQLETLRMMEEDGAESEGQEIMHAVPMIERYDDEDSPGAKGGSKKASWRTPMTMIKDGFARMKDSA